MSAKRKIPRSDALAVAREIYDRLSPFCEKCKVVGSLRRYRSHVGDIELLFVPKMVQKQGDFFDPSGHLADLADLNICKWEHEGYLKRRVGENGTTSWGMQNKLAVHVPSGIPVDLFCTTADNWWVALVIRTGGKRTNLALTMGANKRGLTLHAYGCGFSKIGTREVTRCNSEQDVFRIAGVPYVDPQFRQ